MNSHILHTFGLNLMMADLLVKDLSADQMTQQPHGLINHPAWNLGHLVTTMNESAPLIGLTSSLPEGWAEKFKGGGAPPNPDPALNPEKEELLAEFRSCHERMSQALPGVDPAVMDKPHPEEGFRQFFPTIGDHIIYVMTAHEMDHLGQVAAWRRAMGLKPAM